MKIEIARKPGPTRAERNRRWRAGFAWRPHFLVGDDGYSRSRTLVWLQPVERRFSWSRQRWLTRLPGGE